MSATWINDPVQMPYAKIRFAAVGITNPQPGQMHAALLYENANGEIHALHFCWHHRWRDEAAPPGYFWAQPAVRPSIARSLAALCRMVAEQRALGEIPFAFRIDPLALFDRGTGRFLGPEGQGLTCATFVLAMFASIGLKLVLGSDWPQRACDRDWQGRVLQLLAAHDPVHASLLRSELGAIRYRPEEVIAAAAQKTRPVPFQVALMNGRDVLKRMGLLELACWYDQ